MGFVTSTISDPTKSTSAENVVLPAEENRPEPFAGHLGIRGLSHPQELTLRGIPVMCSACGARRDWLLINRGRDVWIRCRCTEQWLEPEITRADYEAMLAGPAGMTYPTVERAMLALGFDGSFSGAYLS